MPITGRSRELIQKYLEGIASGEELTELETLLTSEAEVADAFVEAVRLDAALGDFFRQQYKMDQVAALLRDPSTEIANHPSQTAQSPRPSGSVFVPRDTRPLSIRRAESSSYPTNVRRHRYWKWIAAALLLATVGVIWGTWKSPPVESWRLASGHISVSGQEVTSLSLNVPFQVVGADAVVLQSSDGTRIELAPTSQATLSGDSHSSILTINSGGGEFQRPAGSKPFRLETPLATVTAQQGRFSLKLIASPPPAHYSPTTPGRYPRLAVSVADGSVAVRQGASLITLSAGDERIFYNPT